MLRVRQGDILKVLSTRFPFSKNHPNMSKSGRIVYIRANIAFVDFNEDWLLQVLVKKITMTRYGWTLSI